MTIERVTNEQINETISKRLFGGDDNSDFCGDFGAARRALRKITDWNGDDPEPCSKEAREDLSRKYRQKFGEINNDNEIQNLVSHEPLHIAHDVYCALTGVKSTL